MIVQTNIKGDYLPMEIIAQFIENLKNLNKNIFVIQSNIEPLLLNDTVSPKLITLINNPEITESINQMNTKLSDLSNMLLPITEALKNEVVYKRRPLKETPYANFIIDEPPVVKNSSEVTMTQLSFDDIIAYSEKVITPVKRKIEISYSGVCPNCGAPNEYLYENSKGKQYKCKCCNNLFSIHPRYHKEISHHCPHCGYALFLHHDRLNYDVLVCPNDSCSFYLNNKRLKDVNEADHLRVFTKGFKLRYTFRLFNFTLDEIKDKSKLNIQSIVDISKIRHSNYTLGLCLTYYINYGLSSRKTAQILEEIHDIKISHQTIVNYAEAASGITEHLNENYNYELTNNIAADETYIKVKGKTNYVFFASDTEKKIITSYRIHPVRDTLSAVKALYQTFKKYPSHPNNLTLVTDGNPIYNAAQVFFKMNDLPFDLFQVIGVKNNDETSVKYRPYKQVEERLNRTYKQNYYGTNGYGTNRNANVYMILYVAFFNFLRKHSSLNRCVPVPIENIEKHQLMPNKWLELINMSYQYLQIA
jgi:transposase-like protein